MDTSVPDHVELASIEMEVATRHINGVLANVAARTTLAAMFAQRSAIQEPFARHAHDLAR